MFVEMVDRKPQNMRLQGIRIVQRAPDDLLRLKEKYIVQLLDYLQGVRRLRKFFSILDCFQF